MPEINLLPWREELREERKQQFVAVWGTVLLVAVLVAFGWVSIRNGVVEDQRTANAALKTGLAELEKQAREVEALKKEIAELTDRMEVIKGLQSNRSEVVKLFNQFVDVMPDGTYVSRVELSNTTFAVQGKTESNQRISTMMRQMDQSEKFAAPNLTTVTADRELGDQGSTFEMTAEVTSENPLTDTADESDAEQ